MTIPRWLEANLGRILKARARSVEAGPGAAEAGPGAEAQATRAVAETVVLCLAALRPRNRWPENTGLYAAIRSRLAEDPLRAAAAFGDRHLPELRADRAVLARVVSSRTGVGGRETGMGATRASGVSRGDWSRWSSASSR